MHFLRILKCLPRFFVTIVSELFANGGLFTIFSHVSVQVAYIMRITQVTLEFINYMLVNNRKFNLMHVYAPNALSYHQQKPGELR